MAQAPEPDFNLPLTSEEKRQIDRLAHREGVSAKEAVLYAVERVLQADTGADVADVLALAQSVYAGLDEAARDEVEAAALDRSRFFGREGP